MKRLKRSCILALVLVIIHLLAYPVYAMEFLYTPLNYPGASSTAARGIDGSNIVGVYHDSIGDHGFLYDGTKWSSLDYPGALSTAATGISGSNIVGGYVDGGNHGFLYDGTKWSSLDYPGGSDTIASDISGSNIVGFYSDATGRRHGFLAIPKPKKVNDLVTFSPISGTYSFTSDASGCPGGFAGKYSFQTRLAGKATSPSLTGLIIEVAALSNGNLLLNAAGGPGGAGSWLTVPKQGGNADGTLGPGESVDIPFVLCLKERKGFSFFVDVLGIAQ